MTTSLDTKIIPKVAAKLGSSKFPTHIYRTYPSRTTDEVTSKVTLGTPVDLQVKGSPLLSFSNYYINGDTILATDGYIVVLPKATDGSVIPEPIPGSVWIIHGQTWKVVTCKTHRPGDDIAVYELQMRQQ